MQSKRARNDFLPEQINRSYRTLAPRRPSATLPISIGLSLGCFLSAVWPPPLSLTRLAALFAILTPLLARRLWRNHPYGRHVALALLALLFATPTGWLWHSPRLPNSALPDAQDERSAWIVEIASLPKPTNKNYKYLVKTHLFCPKDSTPILWNTMANIYVDALDSSASHLQPGQLLLLVEPIRPFETPCTDSASLFDFPTWARTHGIAGYAFANALSLLPIDARNPSAKYNALNMHQNIIDKMKAANIGHPELGPIAAMTFGERSELSADIKRHFRDSGLAHILAISGFHVGIIFWLFQLLVKPITVHSKTSAAARYLTPVVAIWAYAAFCGLAPPIVRAASIVTVYALALCLQVKISRLEAFCISLAVVLLAQPSAPFDIGFYLSFLAVAGIAIFMPFFNDLLPIKNRKMRNIANLFLISLAAQIATAPLILLAFRSLPAIGILASAPASLLAFPILAGGLLMAVLPEASLPALLVALPLKAAGKALVYISETAARINPEALTHIVLPIHTILLAALAVAAFALYALYRKKPLLISTGLLLCAAAVATFF